MNQATRDGKDSGGTFQVTRVWVDRHGRWQPVAFQETRNSAESLTVATYTAGR